MNDLRIDCAPEWKAYASDALAIVALTLFMGSIFMLCAVLA